MKVVVTPDKLKEKYKNSVRRGGVPAETRTTYLLITVSVLELICLFIGHKEVKNMTVAELV